MTRRASDDGARLAWVAPALFLAALLAVPLARLLAYSGTVATLGAWESTRILASLKLGLLTTALALLFGLPLAYLLGRFHFRGRRVLRALCTVPFVMPVVVIAAGLVVLLPRGTRGTYAALLVAHTIFNVPLVVRLVGDAWAHLDPRPEEAAATLGAPPLLRFARVTLPRLAPAILAAALLAFLFGFTAFGTVLLLLDDPVRDATLEVAIYHVGVREFDLPTAATLALEQLGVTFIAALVYAWLIERATSTERTVAEDSLRPLSAASRPLVAFAFLVAAALLLPLGAVVARAFWTPAGVSLAAFARLTSVSTVGVALRNSTWFAIGTVTLALPIGALAAFAVSRSRSGRLWDAAWMLPLGTSAVTLGLGYLLLPIGALRTSALLLVAAHALIAFPFVVRALVGPLRARDPALGEAAATLGARPWQRARLIHLPTLGPAILVGAVLAASVSLGEFGATLVLQRPETTTLPVETYRLLSTVKPDPWIIPEAMAVATILLALNVAAFLALERWRPGRSGGF